MKLCFFVLFSLFFVNGEALINLKEWVDPIILEEKQIIIPGYKDAFNPSIVRWRDGRLLLSFRTRDKLTNSPHLIGFAWLNEEFEVIGEPTLLTIYGGLPLKISRAQDPRLVRVKDTYYIVYNNIITEEDLEKRRMFLAPLNYIEGQFFIVDPTLMLKFEGDPKNSWREKSWSPFDYEGTFLFSYSLNPHRVFYPLMDNNECKTLYKTEQNITWNFGEIRGGTPSLLIDDHYLGFFHSSIEMASFESKGKKMSHYFMGAYLFSKDPPFNLTHISQKPIIGSFFYTAPDYPSWKPLKAIFPAGFVMDDQYVYVVYGRQDHESWVIKIDKKELLKSLTPLMEKAN